MRTRTGTAAKVCIASSAAFIVLCAVFAVFPRLSGSGQTWRGYYLVLVDSTVPAPDVSQALLDAGFRNFISPDRAEVDISMFDEQESVPVSLLYDRFDPEDPRFDRYARRLPELFTTEASGRQFTIFYIPSRENSFFFTARVRRALDDRIPPGAVRFPENRFPGLAVRLILYAIFVTWILRRVGKDRLLLIPGAGSWVFLLVSDGLFTFSGACILFLFWTGLVLAARDYAVRRINYAGSVKRDPAVTFRGAAFAIVWVVYAVLALLPFQADGRIGAALLGLLASGISGAFALSVVVMRQERNLHRLFIPVSIRSVMKGSVPLKPTREMILLSCIVLLGPFPSAVLAPAGTAGVPVFQPSGIGFSWNGIEKLQRNREPGQLPDISEYLAHRAHMEGFPYGRSFGFPAPGETVTLSGFTLGENGKVEEKVKTLRTFDSAWLGDVLRDVKPESPERLFVSQRRPGTVTRGGVSTFRLSPVWIMVHLAFCVFSGLLLRIPVMNLTSPSLYGMRSTIERRDRQVV